MKEMKPGHMSKELVAALGIADGAPPPWLINMQRYGPPPSYPSMKIPGLSAPLPPGASYGYQPGGWGKPPVDEYGRPLYGDVFGEAEGDAGPSNADAAVDKSYRWGELQAPEYAEEEAEGSEDEGSDGEGDGGRRYDPSGAETPSTLDGAQSVALSGISGLETPDTVDLRKRAGMETPDSAYTSVAAGGADVRVGPGLRAAQRGGGRRAPGGRGRSGRRAVQLQPGRAHG
jgi:splicing factor 3B subunit 2